MNFAGAMGKVAGLAVAATLLMSPVVAQADSTPSFERVVSATSWSGEDGSLPIGTPVRFTHSWWSYYWCAVALVKFIKAKHGVDITTLDTETATKIIDAGCDGHKP